MIRTSYFIDSKPVHFYILESTLFILIEVSPVYYRYYGRFCSRDKISNFPGDSIIYQLILVKTPASTTRNAEFYEQNLPLHEKCQRRWLQGDKGIENPQYNTHTDLQTDSNRKKNQKREILQHNMFSNDNKDHQSHPAFIVYPSSNLPVFLCVSLRRIKS